ncbi:MAG: TM2 domain-containing protein [Bacteroidales bacterium]
MKRVNFILLLASAVLMIFISSCTMQKRLYTSGYHIEFKNGNPTTVKKNVDNDEVKNNKNASSIATATTIKESKSQTNDINDVIINDAIINNPTSTNTNENIVASTTNDPVVYTSQKTSSWYNASAVPKTNINTDKKANVKQTNTNNENANAQATKSAGKSWIAALLLCIFLGTLGIHRFYLGYTWQGIVQLLTLGGLGIWTLIDLIRIITKDLQPKSGHYTD